MSVIKYAVSNIETVNYGGRVLCQYITDKDHPSWLDWYDQWIKDTVTTVVNSGAPYSRVSDYAYNRQRNASQVQLITLSYIEYKNSIKTPNWFSRQATEFIDLRLTNSESVKGRPKKPQYLYVEPKAPKKPLLRLLHASDLTPFAVPMRSRDRAKFLARLPVLIKQRELFVAKVNRRRTEVFEKRLQRYEEILTRIKANRKRYDEAYLRRLQNFRNRMAKWELYVKNSKIRDFTTRFGLRHPDPPENPYSYLYLRPQSGGMVNIKYDSYDDYYACTHPLPIKKRVSEFSPLTSAMLTPANFDPFVVSMFEAIVAGSQPLFEELDSKNIRKIYSKISRQEVHVGNLLAERRQTINMLVDIYQRIWKLILLKRKVFSSVLDYFRSPEKIANDILAFKFGVEPLVNDSLALLKFLDSDSEAPIISAHANSKQIVHYENNGFMFDGQIELSYVVKCKINCNPSRVLSRFGLTDVSQIIWEVTPWSFVVDWFLPVGSYIQSLSSYSGAEFYKGTRKVKLTGVFSFSEEPAPLGEALTSCPGPALAPTGKWSGTIISRTVLTEPPDRLKIFRFKNPWSWSHAVETIALILQRLKRFS